MAERAKTDRLVKGDYWRLGILGMGLALVLGGLVWLGSEFSSFSSSKKQELEIIPVAEIKETSEVMVDIAGAVIKPGVYKLPYDARFSDAIASAGGLSTEADDQYISKYLNLAQRVSDGEKIYIPLKEESAGSTGAVAGQQANQPAADRININTASIDQLDSLWGIGPSRAQAIVDNRPYTSVDELLNNKIIPKNVYERINDEIGVY